MMHKILKVISILIASSLFMGYVAGITKRAGFGFGRSVGRSVTSSLFKNPPLFLKNRHLLPKHYSTKSSRFAGLRSKLGELIKNSCKSTRLIVGGAGLGISYLWSPFAFVKAKLNSITLSKDEVVDLLCDKKIDQDNIDALLDAVIYYDWRLNPTSFKKIVDAAVTEEQFLKLIDLYIENRLFYSDPKIEESVQATRVLLYNANDAGKYKLHGELQKAYSKANRYLLDVNPRIGYLFLADNPRKFQQMFDKLDEDSKRTLFYGFFSKEASMSFFEKKEAIAMLLDPSSSQKQIEIFNTYHRAAWAFLESLRKFPEDCAKSVCLAIHERGLTRYIECYFDEVIEDHETSTIIKNNMRHHIVSIKKSLNREELYESIS